MDCSEVCRMNVVRLNSVFTSVSTYSTNTTSYKKKYIKDNNIMGRRNRQRIGIFKGGGELWEVR